MNHLTRDDYAGALRLLARVEAQADDIDRFMRALVTALKDFIAYELTTLSVCDLATGHCHVMGLSGARSGANEVAYFDRHFLEHPLVRHHGFDGGTLTRRISDLVEQHGFERSAFYGEDYSRIGLEYVIAVPLLKERSTLVSLGLSRRRLDFDKRDRERLDLLRPHLAFLYRHASSKAATAGVSVDPLPSSRAGVAPVATIPPGLTQREGEVMYWLARGKTDAAIAALLSISPRTVQKHLEHVYVKLGVETRTAAVMRAISLNKHPVPLQPSHKVSPIAAQPCASNTTSAPAPPSAGRACTKASTSFFWISQP